MRSLKGFLGALVLLAMIPLSLIYQLLFLNGINTFTHALLAAGSLLLSLAVFDFVKLPRWINLVGCLLICAEGLIFLLQAISNVLRSERLTTFAYQVIGQELEGWLARLFIVFWLTALVVLDTRGLMRTVGLLAIAVFAGVEIYRLNIVMPPEVLKVAILGPILWLLFQCKGSRTEVGSELLNHTSR